ncbi:hypothetical protein CEP54_002564 [Fusarium duplospermum]|uniref:Uncharacterized protein n=1 Tax=Fusarium duplospermum TaxID=1325734 RepID=A0A428QU80_9HYPO|nr:hypothetical protein CEP54_002564 [Fusarium duplospermum]
MPPNPPWTTITHPWGEEMVWTSGPESEAFFTKVLRDEALEKKIPDAIRKVTGFKAQGKRVLVYVRDAEAAKLTNEKMRQAGIKSIDFCHTRRGNERATSIWRFNDAKQSEIDAFITSFGLGAGGANFYGACYTGIILQYPDDIHTMMTVQKSFTHIGMTHHPSWHIMHVDNTFNAHEQCELAWKAATSIATFSALHYQEMTGSRPIPEIHASITSQHRLICAHEVYRAIVGRSVSCYPRIRMHWPNMSEPEAITEGKFYAAVGRFLMANPSATHLFTRATMERIAST